MMVHRRCQSVGIHRSVRRGRRSDRCSGCCSNDDDDDVFPIGDDWRMRWMSANADDGEIVVAAG